MSGLTQLHHAFTRTRLEKKKGEKKEKVTNQEGKVYYYDLQRRNPLEAVKSMRDGGLEGKAWQKKKPRGSALNTSEERRSSLLALASPFYKCPSPFFSSFFSFLCFFPSPLSSSSFPFAHLNSLECIKCITNYKRESGVDLGRLCLG